MQVVFEKREELAPGIWEYTFAPERQVDFIPGQYAQFQFLAPLEDPRGRSRTFTYTSLPTDPNIRFVVKFVEPLSSYKQALQAMQPGEALKIGDAMGDLVLPKLATTPLVFIAGGIGISSFVSVLTHLTKEREQREIYLFYRVRNRREQIFRSLTGSYPLALNTLAVAPHTLTADEIIASTPPNSFMYISGSQAFVENMRAGLAENGIPHERIVFDYFDGYADL